MKSFLKAAASMAGEKAGEDEYAPASREHDQAAPFLLDVALGVENGPGFPHPSVRLAEERETRRWPRSFSKQESTSR